MKIKIAPLLLLLCPSAHAALSLTSSASDYVLCASTGNSVLRANTKIFTWSVWVNYTSSVPNVSIMGEQSTNNVIPILRLATIPADGSKILANVRDDNNSIVTCNATPSYNDGQWHHLALTANNPTLNLYIDGSLACSASLVSTGTFATNNLSVGALVRTPITLYFNGLIDDPRVYNRALSASEITALYQSRSRVKLTDGLIQNCTTDDSSRYGVFLGTPTVLRDISNTRQNCSALGNSISPTQSALNYPGD